MSTLIVEVTEIEKIEEHPNADRLEVATVKGWSCIVGRGEFKPKDRCVYIPIDSILPEELEAKIFNNSKIQLEKGRVRTIKLRGVVSQGLVVSLDKIGLDNKTRIGTNVKDILKIAKYEPPVILSGLGNLQQKSKKQTNPHFHKYTDIENIKNFPKIFTEGEDVYISEKLHGTSFRCGWFPVVVDTFWKRVKSYIRILPKYEFCYGSRSVQLQNKLFYKGYYDQNVYSKAVLEYGLKDKLKHGEAVYGEIVGAGIQKGYEYGCKPGEHKFFVYDVSVKGKYLSYEEFKNFCKITKLTEVPSLYVGAFKLDFLKELVKGNSIVSVSQKVREGLVIKPLFEADVAHFGRKVLKYLNEEFLLNKHNTDNH